ncbi:MAG: ATP-binding cassette domain-containing protein [Candidatus Margulisiibacteriota bacterium]
MSAAITISGLKKVYSNGFEALKGIDLVVEQGDFFALLGPNGAGKSTTIGILCGLTNKTEGQVQIGGHSIDANPMAAKLQLGVVPQEFNFSIFEPCIQIVVNQAGYYGVPKAVAEKRADALFAQLGLTEKRNVAAGKLSGGLKRRLMIARALVHQPKILILDEPTAGVDISLRRSMWTFLEALNKEGMTIILTTHYLEEAESLCKKIAIIDQGTIIQNTTISALLNQLNSETFVLYLSAPVSGLSLPGYGVVQTDAQTFEVEVNRDQTLTDLMSHLTALGIVVDRVKNKSNRLEELFIKLVKA